MFKIQMAIGTEYVEVVTVGQQTQVRLLTESGVFENADPEEVMALILEEEKTLTKKKEDTFKKLDQLKVLFKQITETNGAMRFPHNTPESLI